MKSKKPSIKTPKGIKKVKDKNRNKEWGNKWKTVTNIIHINSPISIIMLNVNVPNTLY